MTVKWSPAALGRHGTAQTASQRPGWSEQEAVSQLRGPQRVLAHAGNRFPAIWARSALQDSSGGLTSRGSDRREQADGVSRGVTGMC